MPDVFVEDGSGGELGDFGLLGLGTEAIAFPTRDLGLVFAFTSPPLSRVSSLLARKLAGVGKGFDVINCLLKAAATRGLFNNID